MPKQDDEIPRPTSPGVKTRAAVKRAAKKTASPSKASAAPTKKLPAKKAALRKAASVPKGNGKRDICFVISPFGGWNDRYYAEIYCPAVEVLGLEAHRADDLYRPSAIVHDIWTYVCSAKVMIADLTGKNPNVFYELGLAHAVGKPVILLTQDLEDVPFDLRSLRVIEYSLEDPSWGDRLRERVEAALREVLADPKEAVLAPFLREQAEKQPVASADEKRLIDLSQEIAAMRSEMALLRRSPQGRRRDIEPVEAAELIRSYLDQGVSPGAIVRRVADRGAPPSWVRDRLTEFGIRDLDV